MSDRTSSATAGEKFTLVVLAAMVVVLGYVRFVVLPGQSAPEPLAFSFRNPMLDASDGERVVFYPRENPGNQSCSVVRDAGLVLRPRKGPERIGLHDGLHRGLPYLACSVREERRGVGTCEGPQTTNVLYALNYFGMPMDTDVRVDSIRPRWMKWGDRELAVYEVIFERYVSLEGRWTTYIAPEAPVAGLVKWTRLAATTTEVHFREILGGGR